MVLTCIGDLSRNRRVGLRIGRGEKLRDVLASMQTVAEGVHNSLTVCALARRARVEMPITEQIRLMFHADKPAHQVLGRPDGPASELRILELRPRRIALRLANGAAWFP